MSILDRFAGAVTFLSNRKIYSVDVEKDKGMRGNSEKRNNFNWRYAVYDSLIVAGMHFFGTLAGISVAQIISDPVKALLASFISAGLGFFTTLAIKRGLTSG